MAAVISSGLAITFAIIFQCAPVGELFVPALSCPLTEHSTSRSVEQDYSIQMCQSQHACLRIEQYRDCARCDYYYPANTGLFNAADEQEKEIQRVIYVRPR
jgi:hypothetical protein